MTCLKRFVRELRKPITKRKEKRLSNAVDSRMKKPKISLVLRLMSFYRETPLRMRHSLSILAHWKRQKSRCVSSFFGGISRKNSRTRRVNAQGNSRSRNNRNNPLPFFFLGCCVMLNFPPRDIWTDAMSFASKEMIINKNVADAIYRLIPPAQNRLSFPVL